MSAAWYRYDAAARLLMLNVHVQPNARASAFAGLHGNALRVRIAAPPVDDKANSALLDFLRERLELPPRAVTIRHGLHGRRKTVAISGDASLAVKLEALAAASLS